MALIKRVTRLFQADMHAVLDNLEEPDILLKQSIREMEAALFHDQQRLSALEKSLQHLQTQLTQYKQGDQEMESELAICLQNNNDELAKGCIKRKLMNERLLQAASRKQQGLQREHDELKDLLVANSQRLDAMRQKRDILLTENAVHHDGGYPVADQFHVSDNEIEVALLKAKQKGKTSRSSS